MNRWMEGCTINVNVMYSQALTAFMLCVLVTWRLVTILAAREARGSSLLSSLPVKEGQNDGPTSTRVDCVQSALPLSKAEILICSPFLFGFCVRPPTSRDIGADVCIEFARGTARRSPHDICCISSGVGGAIIFVSGRNLFIGPTAAKRQRRHKWHFGSGKSVISPK